MTQSLGVSRYEKVPLRSIDELTMHVGGRWVDAQFKQRIPTDLLSNHSSFDPKVLNSSAHTIEEAFPDNAIPKRGYIIASLYASVNGTLANPGSSNTTGTGTSAPAETSSNIATSMTSRVGSFSQRAG